MTEAEYIEKKFGLLFVQDSEHVFRFTNRREAVSILFPKGFPHTPLGALNAFVTAYGRVENGRATEALREKVEIMRRKFFYTEDRLDAVLLDPCVREGKIVEDEI